MNLLHTVATAAVGILLIGGSPLAAQDDCKPVFDALNKVMTVPVHIYSSTPVSGKPKTTESIYTEDGIFTNGEGKWVKSSMRREQVGQQEMEGRKKGDNSCKYVKDETVNGEATAVYTTRMETSERKTEGQIWISRSAGLPVRNEVDLLSGGKRTHYSVKYEYKNVAPPKL
jgi:hypothetical protein